MRRWSLWVREHPMIGDSLLAALLGLWDLLTLFNTVVDGKATTSTWSLSIPISVVVITSVIFRRKHPVRMAYLVLLCGFAQSLVPPGSSGGLAIAIALYTLLVYLGRRAALYYLGAITVETIVEYVITHPDGFETPLIAVLVLAFCWVLGEFVGARRAYQAELEARLHLLETEQDQAARIAINEERSRIARELHDVVAHSVSVMVVQASGASYAMKENPAMAEKAVKTIAETGRSALLELRNLVKVLREEGGEDLREPQPDADSISSLVERIRVAGVPIELEVVQPLSDLPAGISLGIHRIVQESLTNVLKHAGQGARARVRIERNTSVVNVEVTDDGAGKAHALSGRLVGAKSLPGGNGIIGMRERATVFGGRLEAGPQPEGGWRVNAVLPVKVTGY